MDVTIPRPTLPAQLEFLRKHELVFTSADFWLQLRLCACGEHPVISLGSKRKPDGGRIELETLLEALARCLFVAVEALDNGWDGAWDLVYLVSAYHQALLGTTMGGRTTAAPSRRTH